MIGYDYKRLTFSQTMKTIHIDYTNPAPAVRKRIAHGTMGDIILATRPIASGELLCQYRGMVVSSDAQLTPTDRQRTIVLPSGRILLPLGGEDASIGEYILDPGFTMRHGTVAPPTIAMMQSQYVDHPSTHSRQSYANTRWMANCGLREDRLDLATTVDEDPHHLDSTTISVGIYATRNIAAGEEFFIHHGDATWNLRNADTEIPLTLSGVTEVDQVILSYLPDATLDHIMEGLLWEEHTTSAPIPYINATPTYPIALRRDSRVFYWRLCDMIIPPPKVTIKVPTYRRGSNYYALWYSTRRATPIFTTTSPLIPKHTLGDALRHSRMPHPWGLSEIQRTEAIHALGGMPTPNGGNDEDLGWDQGTVEMLLAFLEADYWQQASGVYARNRPVGAPRLGMGVPDTQWGEAIVTHIVSNNALPLLQPVLDMLSQGVGTITAQGVWSDPRAGLGVSQFALRPTCNVRSAISILWSAVYELGAADRVDQLPGSLVTMEALLAWIQRTLPPSVSLRGLSGKSDAVPLTYDDIDPAIRACALTPNHMRSLLSIVGSLWRLDRYRVRIIHYALTSEYCHPSSYADVAAVVADTFATDYPADADATPVFASGGVGSTDRAMWQVWGSDIDVLCMTYLTCARMMSGIGGLSHNSRGTTEIERLYQVVHDGLPIHPPMYREALSKVHRAFLGDANARDLLATPRLRQAVCSFDCLVLTSYLSGHIARTSSYPPIDEIHNTSSDSVPASTLSALIRATSSVELTSMSEPLVYDLIRHRNQVLLAASFDPEMVDQLYPIFGLLQEQGPGKYNVGFEYTLWVAEALHITELITSTLNMHYNVMRSVDGEGLRLLVDLTLGSAQGHGSAWVDKVVEWMQESDRELGGGAELYDEVGVGDMVLPYNGLRQYIAEVRAPPAVVEAIQSILRRDLPAQQHAMVTQSRPAPTWAGFNGEW